MAAEAMAAAFERLPGSTDVRVVDLVDAIGSWRLRQLPEAYGAALRLAPWAYDWWWRRSKPGILNDPSNSRRLLGRFRRLLEDAGAEAVVCTHAVAARLSARLRQARMEYVNAFVLTDFGCHGFWPCDGADLALAPSREVADRLISRGLPARRVHACGIPLRAAFWSCAGRGDPSDRASPLRRPAVLVMAGSTQRSLYRAAAEAARALVRVHARTPSAFDLSVVTGSDDRLRRELLRAAAHPNCRVFGYVDDVPGLLHRADLLAAKPGGLATAEALAAGVPLLYVGPCAGQERSNVEFAVSKGAAVHARDPAGVRAALDELLQRPGQLRRMAERARSLGRPRAALDAAALVLAAVDDRRRQLRGDGEGVRPSAAVPVCKIGAALP
jgi:processive 1,2-diacylglycerol beta-glucosyltransferase